MEKRAQRGIVCDDTAIAAALQLCRSNDRGVRIEATQEVINLLIRCFSLILADYYLAETRRPARLRWLRRSVARWWSPEWFDRQYYATNLFPDAEAIVRGLLREFNSMGSELRSSENLAASVAARASLPASSPLWSLAALQPAIRACLAQVERLETWRITTHDGDVGLNASRGQFRLRNPFVEEVAIPSAETVSMIVTHRRPSWIVGSAWPQEFLPSFQSSDERPRADPGEDVVE